MLPRFPEASGCTVSALCHHCYYTQCLFAVSTVTQLIRSLRYFAQSVGEMALQCDATSTITMSRGSTDRRNSHHCVNASARLSNRSHFVEPDDSKATFYRYVLPYYYNSNSENCLSLNLTAVRMSCSHPNSISHVATAWKETLSLL